MTRVVSFKVPDQIYDELKKQDGTFKDFILPLVVKALEKHRENTYTDDIHKRNREPVSLLKEASKRKHDHITWFLDNGGV